MRVKDKKSFLKKKILFYIFILRKHYIIKAILKRMNFKKWKLAVDL